MFNPQYNIGTPLTGNPSPLSPTFPAIQDYSSSIKNYGNSVLNGIKFSNSKLNNPVPSIATPEQISHILPNNNVQNANSEFLNNIGTAIGSDLKSSSNPLGKKQLLNNTANLGFNIAKAILPQAEDKGSQVAGQVTDSLGDVAGVIPGFGPILKLGLKGISTAITSIGPNVKGNTDKELTDRSSSFGGLSKLNSKKFGLFGIGKGRRYRDKVNEREEFRNQSEDILYSSNLDREANAGSIQNLANKYHLMMNGGWQQTNGIRAGKSGMKYDLSFAHSVLKAQKGVKVLDTFSEFLNSLPENQKDSTNFRIKRYWELNGKPKNFEEAKKLNMYIEMPDGWHASSVAYNKDKDEYEFMKFPNHPTIWKEETWYNGFEPILIDKNSDVNDIKNYRMEPLKGKEKEESDNFRTSYNLDKSGEFWKYIKKSDTQKFQIGGKMNVIPEGALHARKNNMDDSSLDGKITKKGIPVMHNDGGELKQVAEIEKNEIIFTKEVTEKLEELRDKGTDEAAIEAGKLLVKEILYNTEDNTGLLKIVM